MSRNTRKQRFSIPLLRRRTRKAPKFVRKQYRFEGLEAKNLLAADMMGLGDLNGDTHVNGNDFMHWQQSLPTANVAQAQTDLAAWQTNFGTTGVGGNHGQGHQQAHAHPAAMALVSLDQATHTVVASGNWSDPSVWQDGTLPTAGARIVIPEGMTLTVDGQIAEEFKTIRIDGTLQFATNVNTELRVDTLVSSPTGCFVMGTASNPIAADVTARVVFADDGAIDQNWDPEQISRGALLHGPVEIHGAETTHRVTLAAFPAAGDTSIQLSSVPTGWDAGDQIVITGTQGSTSDEVRTIQSIDGTTVQLNEALQVDHIPPKSDLNVYVANTTRNVEFTSENSNIPHRGHIMFMHQLNVKVKNASFNELGRTDKSRELDDIMFDFAEDVVGNETSAGVVFTTSTGERTNVRGRYAVHFHRGGNDPSSHPALIEGSVVNGSPGWGFVNHSGNVNMVNNVAYRVQGASFYTEAGDEIGSMVGNIAIRTVSPTFRLGDEGAIDPDLQADTQSFGVDGDGYWLSGHLVSMRDNVSAGASGHGIIIWSDGLVEADRGRATVKTSDIANGHLITGRDTIPTWWAPLAEISNNESYGATIGFRSRYVHSSVYLGENGSDFHAKPDQAYVDTLNPVVDGLTVWGSRDGVLMNYNERMSLRNARLVGIGAPWVQNGGTADHGVGIDMYNEVSRGPGVIENVSIEGYGVGLLAPRQDAWTVNNLQLANTTDLYINESRQSPRTLDMNNVTFGSLDGTAVQDTAGQRRNVVMRAETDGDGFQPYFFLMRDRIQLNGQSLYFNQQANDYVPVESVDPEASVAPISPEFAGQTNQQLWDRYGTSFGGALLPADAMTVGFVEGGVVGSAPATPGTTPPLYDMTAEGAAGIIIDPGTLTNFSGPLPSNNSQGETSEQQPSDEDGDTEATDADDASDSVADEEPNENEPNENEPDGDGENAVGDDNEDAELDEDLPEDLNESDDAPAEQEPTDEPLDDEPLDNEPLDDEEQDELPDDEPVDGEEDNAEDDGELSDDDTDEGDADESATDEGDTEESDADENDTEECDLDDGEEDEDPDQGDEQDPADNDDTDADDSDADDTEGEGDLEGEIVPVEATLVGTDESEKLQGFESNDTVTGGSGADLFPLTTGNDVITDFNPAEDLLDVGDFARESDEFATLTSLDDLAAAATETTIDGETALVIDVDGELGNSRTTLLGVTLDQLSADNVFFGLGEDSIPPLDFTHLPTTTVMLNDGTVAEFEAHDLSVHPLPFELIEGNQSAVDALNQDLSPNEDDESEEEPNDDDQILDIMFETL